MKKLLSVLLALCLLCSALPMALAQADGPRTVTTVFQPAMSPLMQYDVVYDEGVFLHDSGEYDHVLCRMSLAMALAAFRPESLEADQSANIVSFYEQAGMENIRVEQYGVNTDENTIGTVIASKQIGTGADSFTLVAAVVCGGRYRNEWLSNFKVGDPETGVVSTHHLGFYEAAQKVAERLRLYLGEIAGPAKLWISGYSRGAAVSNLSAALALKEGLFLPENVFAYSFATPTNTRDENAGADTYRGLYSVTGMFDAVPQVPLTRWGFTRYGRTLVLPSAETDLLYYGYYYPNAYFWSMEHLGIPFYNTTFVNYTVTKILETLGAAVPTPEEYVSRLQAKLIQLWKDKGNMLALIQVISDLYEETSAADDGWALTDLLSESAWQGVLQWAGQSSLDVSAEHSIGQNLGREHFPDCYVSLLMSCEAEELFNGDRGYMRISVPSGCTLTIVPVLEGIDEEDYEALTATVTGQGSSDYLWPVVTLSDGSIVSLPLGQCYLLSLQGNPDHLPMLVFQEYRNENTLVGEQVISVDVETGKETWYSLLDLTEALPERTINFYYSNRTSSSFANNDLLQAGLMDLIFITSNTAFDSLQTVGIVLAAIVMVLVSVLVLAAIWAFRGRTRKASVTLFILLGVLFVLIHLSVNLLPAQGAFWAVLKGLATTAVLMQCLLCALQNKCARNYLILGGMLLYIVNDVLINYNLLWGMIASFLGNLLFTAGFLCGPRPGKKQVPLGLATLALGAALLYHWRNAPDVKAYLPEMIVYVAVVALMAFAVQGQNPLIRLSVLLMVLSDIFVLYNQINGVLWWVYVLSLGLYYAAMSILALGVKDGARLPSYSARGERRIRRRQEKKAGRHAGGNNPEQQ